MNYLCAQLHALNSPAKTTDIVNAQLSAGL